mmetsp:Transcript_35089/g.87398  ORF Transcript_35089/g.87398 Transcript_35089/m.87398 type:complete len:210 (-) Transcript_35089:830-1459(-)
MTNRSTIIPLMRRKPPVIYQSRVKAPPVWRRKTVEVAICAITWKTTSFTTCDCSRLVIDRWRMKCSSISGTKMNTLRYEAITKNVPKRSSADRPMNCSSDLSFWYSVVKPMIKEPISERTRHASVPMNCRLKLSVLPRFVQMISVGSGGRRNLSVTSCAPIVPVNVLSISCGTYFSLDMVAYATPASWISFPSTSFAARSCAASSLRVL